MKKGIIISFLLDDIIVHKFLPTRLIVDFMASYPMLYHLATSERRILFTVTALFSSLVFCLLEPLKSTHHLLGWAAGGGTSNNSLGGHCIRWGHLFLINSPQTPFQNRAQNYFLLWRVPSMGTQMDGWRTSLFVNIHFSI